MTHDPTKGCYTLDTLRALNPLYDHEHGLTQQDVEAVNAMKKYIESTRSADRPQCGDRVRYVSRHGQSLDDCRDGWDYARCVNYPFTVNRPTVTTCEPACNSLVVTVGHTGITENAVFYPSA